MANKKFVAKNGIAVGTGHTTTDIIDQDGHITANTVTISGTLLNATAFAGTANNASYLEGSNGSYYTGYADNKAANAYSNAIAYSANATNISSGTLTANVLPTSGVTAATYGNSSSIPVITIDATGRITSATTNAVAGVTGFTYTPSNATFIITTGAGSTFPASISSANDSVAGIVKVLDSVSNTDIYIAASANSVKTAYDNATTAYSNAATYADNKAANAYSNATSYAASIAGTAYSNATTFASSAAATAYSNAVSAASSSAATAYSNATTFAANATNISSGTLAELRLPFRMDQNVRTNDTVSFGNMTITGNLTVTGTTVTVNANNLSVQDNMIYLNSNSSITNPDLGIAGNYNDGTYRHAGFFRDASDGVWKVFDQYLPEPDASPYIDTANASFRIANFQANVVTASSFSGNGASVTSVDAATVGGNTAGTLRGYSDSTAATAYSNATSYAATIAGTAYSNAVSYFTTNYTASDVLTKIKTVDGAGSGLDADLLDGQSGSYYAANSSLSSYLPLSGGTLTGGLTGTSGTFTSSLYSRKSQTAGNYTTAALWTESYDNTTTGIAFHISGNVGKFLEMRTNGILYWNNDTVWHSGNDGAGSGLDADLLDGYSSSALLDGAEQVKDWGNLSASGEQARRYTIGRVYGTPNHWIDAWQNIRIKIIEDSYNSGYVEYDLHGFYGMGDGNSWVLRVKDAGGSGDIDKYRISLGTVTYAGWTYAGANTYYQDIYLDVTYYKTVRVIARTYGHGYTNSNPGSGTAAHTTFYDSPSGTNISYTNDDKYTSYLVGSKIWNISNDGSGSGLDADTLDGVNSSGYWTKSGSWYGSGLPGSRLQGISASGGEFVLGDGLPNAGQIGVLIDGAYVAGENNGFWSLASDNTWGSRRGFTWDGSAVNFTTNSPRVRVSSIDLNYSGYYMTQGDWGWRHVTPDGWIQFGPANSSYAHIYTDRGNFYFNVSTLYANGSTMWHAGNDGSGSGLDADLLDGLEVSGARNDVANKIVRTDGNGYIQAGWINTPSGDSGYATRLTKIYSSYDDYIRYSTLTDFKVHMSLSAKNNYSRRIDYTSDTNYHVGSFGHGGYGANETFHGGSGFFDIWSGTNFPSGTSHIHGFNALHYTTNSLGSTGGNAYGIQLAGQYDQGGTLFTRGCSGGSFSSWHKIWSAANDGSGSGLDADLLDGYNLSSSASGSTVALRDGSARLYTHLGEVNKNSDWVASFQATPVSGYTWHGDISTGGPTGTWWFYESMRHSNSGNYWGTQIAWGWEDNANQLYQRNVTGNSFSGWVKYWNSGNDGSGSGLDADLLDGLNSNSFLRGAGNVTAIDFNTLNYNSMYVSYIDSSPNKPTNYAYPYGVILTFDPDVGSAGRAQFYVSHAGNDLCFRGGWNGNDSWQAWNRVWTNQNDGSGSGLDADLLDGISSGSFTRNDTTQTLGNIWYFQSNQNHGGSNPPLQAFSGNASGAIMAFHRGGYYAVNFGLDSDNVMRIGGWSASTNRWQLDMSGNMTVAGNITASSDIRLKKDIQVIENAIEKVKQIRGVTFTRIDKGNEGAKQAGVIAQEVEKVLPEVVMEDNEGVKNVAYGNMVGLLIEAIKEQQKQIEELKAALLNK